jgi:hypothetical protein
MVSRVLAALRILLRRLLLRGRLLDWWVERRARQWERAYVAELLRNPAAPAASAVPPKRVSTSGLLRQILIIADCMWEKSELQPELERICRTHLLDLRPWLNRTSHTAAPAETVATAVRDFARDDTKDSPDVILFYARPGLLSEEVFHVLHQRWKCPLLGLNLDDKQQFFPYGIFRGGDDNYQHWAREFDLNLTNCRPALEWYQQHGLPCFYSPSGVHRPAHLVEPHSADFQTRFGFLGSMKPERRWLIDQLTRAGVEINLLGAGWPNGRWADDQAAVFRSTQINLGIGYASPSHTLTTVKGRDFECPGLGGCYLTTYNWELPLHYELGREILCYRSVEELIEMYAFYRKRPEECLRIAQAAWRRCAAEHTWEKRFRKVFQQTGFKV